MLRTWGRRPCQRAKLCAKLSGNLARLETQRWRGFPVMVCQVAMFSGGNPKVLGAHIVSRALAELAPPGVL